MSFTNNPFSNLFAPKPAPSKPASTPTTTSYRTTNPTSTPHRTTPQDHHKSHLQRSSHSLISAGAPATAAYFGHILQKHRAARLNQTHGAGAVAGQKRKRSDNDSPQASGESSWCTGCGIPSVPGWTCNVQITDPKREHAGSEGRSGKGKGESVRRSKRRRPEWDARKIEKRKKEIKEAEGAVEKAKVDADDAVTSAVRQKCPEQGTDKQEDQKNSNTTGTQRRAPTSTPISATTRPRIPRPPTTRSKSLATSTGTSTSTSQPQPPPDPQNQNQNHKLLTQTCTRCLTRNITVLARPVSAAQAKESNKARKPKEGAPVLGGPAVSRSKKAKERKKERAKGVLGKM
ncbi:MAG: hypothetical protein M1831_006564 [Alyxoria varia]|nr:MAG: hypothetical protein M1831_006564 [Alyxoria varia]